ncbi:o-succinylbenzoate--CoA ligase [Erwiniaceae bacterium BAC15a-03b]|uniref:O-succinylbenzoate--CoA ligase n=1 Tax=Winslowiella arboricola TaxID=2978220 RepID=A0A9J6PQM8_9GAMM|nr:o-succinylbenzoate--CoA ligase [Winslowiella arboricola]MCU5771317.1 o-succinylbenzoate--CoA ligase [Winslowiella arboricola]MCU5777052.1 o-succinylbenzoate--CoA ligase [Winslowiella arboricola]
MARLTQWPWQHWARLRGAESAIICASGALNWQQLALRINALAVGFRQQGVQPGSGVLLKSKNSEDALLAYLALLQCGARLLPLNPQLPDSQLHKLLPHLNLEFSLSLATPAADYPLIPLQLRSASGCSSHHWDGESLATLTLTSGSSGVPKAAAHSFNAHLACARGVVDLLSFRADDSWLLSLPLYHVSGQGIIWRWLLTGARLKVAPQLPLAQALADCSFASLVPTQLWRLLQQDTLPAGVQNVLLGGATIPRELLERAEAAGIRCWCGYGMTEAASTIAAKRANGRDGVGQVLGNAQIKLVDGEVWLRSAALACGYWQDGELLPLTDSAGWLHTRDAGIWRDGELQLCGRLDNQFFSGGEGIQPEQIERLLLSHPAISMAFIIPRADKEYGQRPVALLEWDRQVSLQAIAQWATDKLATFQLPVAWYDLPPDLSSGGIKLPRNELINWVNNQPVNND